MSVSLGVSQSANSTVQIEFELAGADHIALSVADLKGVIIDKIYEKHMEAGNHKINRDLKAYPSGTYVILLRTSDGLVTHTLIKK